MIVVITTRIFSVIVIITISIVNVYSARTYFLHMSLMQTMFTHTPQMLECSKELIYLKASHLNTAVQSASQVAQPHCL